ncbi:MAG: multiheme c-type cytochrome [Candidatus Neomarinimicrobiota bacterium]
MNKRLSGYLVILLLLPAFLPAQDAARCMVCHKEKTPGLYRQWLESTHAEYEVTCIDCHGAAEDDVDAFLHEDSYVATLVTPDDCGICHEKEMEEVGASYHATAGMILESQDAYLANVLGGHQVVVTGCESCHGARIKIDPNSPNKLDRQSWPNSGIGRINPDGSKGSCNACHTRHGFSKAQARQPEACSKCHLGPDHPQKEVYEESKHGNIYYTNRDKMNLDSYSWIVGEDYYEAPTCVTCHMGATRFQESTHDVGNRIQWSLRPPISQLKDDYSEKRKNMKDVCQACHTSTFISGHFYQFDSFVKLYDEKFARPATELIDLIKKKGLLENQAAFGNGIEWIYWELWHHEGRRARHGVAMAGPDYAWWHGMYDVAHNFYFKLLPEARKLNDAEVNAMIDRLLIEDPLHNWMNRSESELKKAIHSGELEALYRRFYDSE